MTMRPHFTNRKIWFGVGVGLLLLALPIQCYISDEIFIDRVGALSLAFFVVSEFLFSRETASKLATLRETELDIIRNQIEPLISIQEDHMQHSVSLSELFEAVLAILNASTGSRSKESLEALDPVIKTYKESLNTLSKRLSKDVRLREQLDKLKVSTKQLNEEQNVASLSSFHSWNIVMIFIATLVWGFGDLLLAQM